MEIVLKRLKRITGLSAFDLYTNLRAAPAMLCTSCSSVGSGRNGSECANIQLLDNDFDAEVDAEVDEKGESTGSCC